MDLELLKQAEPYTKRHRRKSYWSRLMRFLSCVVVFCTTYALILPAITQEREAFCGQNPHVHEESCYTRLPQIESSDLTCSYDSLSVHTHSPDCYDEFGCVLCGQADYIVHSHDEICYDEEGLLICKLPEAQQHQHSDDCSRIVGAHTHDDGCFIYHQGELICTETAAHPHSRECYQAPELLCQLPASHTHNENCYLPGALTCAHEEHHMHGDSCFGHDELTCSEPEGHSHSDSCYAPSELICGIPAAHLHHDECFAPPPLICEDADAHVHSSECYEQIPELVCTLEEAEGELTLICTEPEAPSHQHTEACFEPVTERHLLCDLEDGDHHEHDDDCYGVLQLSCELPEHTHDLTCYSDHTADTETEEDWEFLIAGIELTGDPAADLLAVAKSQLGYQESSTNYILAEGSDIPQGYTRYGEWHGTPYEDWNVLFAAFCIAYSDAMPLPDGTDPQDWLERLSETCAVPADAEPSPGELIFFDSDGDGKADRVGIVSGTGTSPEAADENASEASAVLLVIEGDSNNQVREVSYDLSDETILGRILPCGLGDDPIHVELRLVCGYEEHAHHAECYGEEEELLCTLEEHTHHPEACTQLFGYTCETAEHTHSHLCYDESNTLLCEAEEHIHGERCLEPMLDLCGMTEHRHSSDCYDEDHDLICGLKAHTHRSDCFMADPYRCGFKTHFHSDSCYGNDDMLICPMAEHEHTIVCTADLSHLTRQEYQQVAQVILAIDELPTWEEVEEELEEFEADEDPDGEDSWLRELYQLVGGVYDRYIRLSPELEAHIFNRDKLLDLEFIWSMAILADVEIGVTTPFSDALFAQPYYSFVFYTQGMDDLYYAIDGNGSAVPINIDEDGVITAGISDKSYLLWTVVDSDETSYRIRNLATGAAMYVTANTSVRLMSRSAEPQDTGVNLLDGENYVQLNEDAPLFSLTDNAFFAATYAVGAMQEVTLYFDGTNGDLMSLRGSSTASYTARGGEDFTLPETWPTPAKYQYTLHGWYDVKNGVWYAPGETITVTEELLFYADWVAATYNIGEFNSHVVETVSTNDFITTHVFDYNSLFNTYSLSNNYTGGSTATWTMVDSGAVTNGSGDVLHDESLNFIFVDHDSSGHISHPNGRNAENGTEYQQHYPGLYNADLADLLFDPDTEALGKLYLGTGDHMFQYGSDPNDTEHYGYYYYDSALNAASYNQSEERFYVYNYLERTTDSAGNNSYSDFLPLNSPYANTNGKTTGTYEHQGATHLSYDSRYSGDTNSTNHIMANFASGSRIDLEFYLPSQPGIPDSEGNNPNLSITGDDMVFEFSGDDDVWVLISKAPDQSDSQLVLDIGGIHVVQSGSIDFSTGTVEVEGVVDEAASAYVRSLKGGSYTLTMYYLERGSSMSNFKLRFNLSTRYSMTLQKEDTLTAHLLKGAEFSVYTDISCAEGTEAELWPSRAAHERGDNPTNAFTVPESGAVTLWGLAAGNTYYLVETRGPDSMQGVPSKGIIRMKLNSHGQPDYEVLPDQNEELTVGYTVHGYKVNEDTQEAFIVVTNTDPEAKIEPTEIYVEKKWADGGDHDPISVYLLADGKRIQTVTLSDYNNWRYTWTNMPKTDSAGNPVTYTVREATVPGYMSAVGPYTPSSGGSGGGSQWTEQSSFESNETYLLKTSMGYLSASNGKLYWESNEATAKDTPTSQWIVTVHSADTVSLKNRAGMTLYYSPTAFFAGASPANGAVTTLNYSNGKLFYYRYQNQWYQEQRYMSTTIDNYNGVIHTVENRSDSKALTFTLYKEEDAPLPPSVTPTKDGFYYLITNTPADKVETVSLTVKKEWNLGNLGQTSDYETLTVEMDLLADEEETGLSGKLNLRNGWTYTFDSLPKYNSEGNEISYTVEEANLSNEWSVSYSAVTPIHGSSSFSGAYETTVTNTYAMTYLLPETGGHGIFPYTTGGFLLVIASGILLLYPYNTRRKKEGQNTS